jgi:arylformamidase
MAPPPLPPSWDPTWDAATLDREYSPSTRVPDLRPYLDEYAARSADARTRHEVRRLRYGPGPAETVDVFPAPATGHADRAARAAPLHAFVHGGNWQALTVDDSAFAASRFLAAGVAFAAVGYPLAPAAGLAEIVAAVGRCLRWLHGRAAELGADPSRLQVSGHSAGAHLVAMALAAEPELAEVVAGVVLVSGMYDLEPVRRSYVNDALRLDAGSARRHSPLWHLPPRLPPVVIARGGNETRGYAMQHDAMLAALRGRAVAGEEVVDVVDERRNHFDLPHDLPDPATPLGAAVRAQPCLGGAA